MARVLGRHADLAALLRVAIRKERALQRSVSGGWLARLWYGLRHRLRANTRSGSRRNIHAHFDIGNAFYARWLDPTSTYSSAVFDGDFKRSLEDAQHAKYRRIIDTLGLHAGMHLPEIGCGWGGFAMHAARQGIHVHGVTISPAQLEYARARVSEAGLHDLVQLELRDYRTLDGQYDGIVSIEMFDAFGEPFWPAYFAILRECLGPGACALVQTITIDDSHFAAYRATSDFIREFIFPGGMLPSPQRFAAAARQACGAHVAGVWPRPRGDLASLAVRFRNADRADPRAGLRRDLRAHVAAVSGVRRSGLRRRPHGREVRSGEGRLRGRLRTQPRSARSRRRRMSSQPSRAPLRKSRTSANSRSSEKSRAIRQEQARAQRLHEANEANP